MNTTTPAEKFHALPNSSKIVADAAAALAIGAYNELVRKKYPEDFSNDYISVETKVNDSRQSTPKQVCQRGIGSRIDAFDMVEYCEKSAHTVLAGAYNQFYKNEITGTGKSPDFKFATTVGDYMKYRVHQLLGFKPRQADVNVDPIISEYANVSHCAAPSVTTIYQITGLFAVNVTRSVYRGEDFIAANHKK